MDRSSFTSVAALRMVIEIRIRSAFGIQAYHDHKNRSIKSIDLDLLLEEMRQHVSEIESVVVCTTSSRSTDGVIQISMPDGVTLGGSLDIIYDTSSLFLRIQEEHPVVGFQ
jgi:hypothetical protein